jgi:hypothetical protein
VALVVVGFVALLVWDLLVIKRELEAGKEHLDGLTFEAAATTGIADLADVAAGDLERAADRSHRSLPLRVLGLLPGVDDQVASLRLMADAAARLGSVAASAATRIDEDLQRAGEPAGRIALLDTALDELDRIEATLDGVDLGSPDGLLPPLRDAHEDLVDAITSAREKLTDGRALITPVREMLAGPSTFVLLAANNAEMAGGAGLALSTGILTFNGGDFDLSDVVNAGDLRLPASVPIPDRVRDIYYPTGVGIDLRSTTRSPDLSVMGPIVARIMAQYGLTDIDGVVVVDALALRDLMVVTGGVRVAGKDIDAENVLEEVLHANYLEFDTLEERDDRVSYQGDIAKAVFDTLTTRDVSSIELADALLTSSEGRHLMLWAADPDLQRVWEDLGVAGELDKYGLMISFQNYAASKMDWYLRPRASLDVDLLPSGGYRAHLTMTLDMPAREDIPDASAYVLGPTPEAQGVFLTVHLPEAAYDITTTDPHGFRTQGVEPPMQVRTFLVDVPLGTTFERLVEFSLPREVGALWLLPSARLEPMPLTIDDVATIDDASQTAILWLAGLPPPGVSTSTPIWVRVPALIGLAATVMATGLTAAGLLRRRRLVGTTTWPLGASYAAGLALVCFALAGAIALAIASPLT